MILVQHEFHDLRYVIGNVSVVKQEFLLQYKSKLVNTPPKDKCFIISSE